MTRIIPRGLLAALFAGLLGAGPARADDDRPPNIVLVFADDLGYGDVSAFGDPEGFDTPHIDRLAEEGARFTDFYVAASVCSPSRAALLTGCYPPRVSVPGVLFPRHEKGLHPGEVTIADLLRRRGYATACFGKWHLGHDTELLPTRQGFDTYLGIPYSNDMRVDPEMPVAEDCVFREGESLESLRAGGKGNRVPLLEDEEVVEYPVDQSTLTKRYTERAVEFIEEHRDAPFFVYLPHTMPHIPLYASEEFRGTTERGLYGDVVRELDASVGAIVSTLEELELARETLVVFTSDNGPWLGLDASGRRQGGTAGPLRKGKFSVYEGGMRVPAVAWWPGRIPAGTTCDEIASTIDLLPTFAHLAGLEVPADRVIDGRDIRGLLFDPEGARSPHEFFFYYRGNGLRTVRSGRWKLHAEGPQLYDLESDLGERDNVAAEHPEQVERLEAVMGRFNEELRAARRPPGRAGDGG